MRNPKTMNQLDMFEAAREAKLKFRCCNYDTVCHTGWRNEDDAFCEETVRTGAPVGSRWEFKEIYWCKPCTTARYEQADEFGSPAYEVQPHRYSKAA
jgi:hypothetical protein